MVSRSCTSRSSRCSAFSISGSSSSFSTSAAASTPAGSQRSRSTMRSTTASRSLVACSTRPSRRTRLSRAPASSPSAPRSALSASPSRVSPTSQPVGRFLALHLGLGDLLAQRFLLGLDLGRLGRELGDGRRDLLAPRVELADLAIGIGQAIAPAGMILRDLAEPLSAHGGLARQAIAVAFGFDQRGAQLGDARAQASRRRRGRPGCRRSPTAAPGGRCGASRRRRRRP